MSSLWLLLQQLNAGRNEAIWLDSDTIVTRPITSLLEEFPRDSLIVAEEWDRHEPIPVYPFLGHVLGAAGAGRSTPVSSVRLCPPAAAGALAPVDSTIRATARRSRSPLNTVRSTCRAIRAPERSAGKRGVWTRAFDYLRLGRHIAQCAGSSGYRPAHRLLDLFRGLPPLIHCIGRKPWQSRHDRGRIERFLTDLATDVSPYVLASRKVAKALDVRPSWLDARTSMGAMLRGLTAYHPGMAGLPLATLHAFGHNISQAIQFRKPRVAEVPVLSTAFLGAESMTSILGISAFYHDSAAALVVDGEIIAAAQEERFTRKKHDPGFPARAIAYCLEEAGLEVDELDYVAFYDKPLTKFERLLETYLAYAPSGFRSFCMAMPLWLKDKLHMRRTIRRGLGGATKARILFMDHHESHAASAFFPSPFEEAAILTLDGVGEWSTTTYGTGAGNRIQLTHQIQFPHSLGLLYSAFTYYCGFKVNSGEYKLMGLAPYGRPIYQDAIYQALDRSQAGRQFLVEHGLLQLLPGPDHDQPPVSPVVRGAAAASGDSDRATPPGRGGQHSGGD